MYKVKTQQELIPFEALEVIRPTTPTALAVQQVESDNNAAQSPERHVDYDPNPRQSAPKLLPAPVLLPTTYSIRRIEYIRSSPPMSPERLRSEDITTPVAWKARRLNAGADASPEKERVELREDLTSSVVKGQAANSLIELMRRG